MELELIQFSLLVVYIFIVGVVLAILEIQIEGRDGWAANLPAWKPHPESRLHKTTVALTKKDMTGYHMSLFALLLLFFHLPFLWNWTWNWQQELQVMAFFFVFAVIWDFLWFVLNPHYSLKAFNSTTVWWHRSWIFGMPVDYIMGFLFAAALYIPLILQRGQTAVWELAALFSINLLLICVVTLLYPHSNGKSTSDHS